jgi:hypothetical protein
MTTIISDATKSVKRRGIARNVATCKAWVPRGFDFERLDQSGDKGRERMSDRCRKLASDLYRRAQGHRIFQDWTPISSRHLKGLLGKDYYRAVLDRCISIGLVEHNGRRNYSVGRYSRHYRLGSQFWHHDWELVEVPGEGWSASTVIADLPSDAYKWAAESALRVEIDEIPRDVIARAANEAHRQHSKTALADEMALAYDRQIEAVRYKMQPPVCDQYGRLHTAITNLKTEFRNYLRLDGERLAGVDIRTSQPLFLGLLVADGERTRTHIDRAGTVAVTGCQGVIGCQPEGNESDDAGSAADWLRFVCEGDLYDWLWRETGLGDSRDDYKERYFFRAMYGPNLEDCPTLEVIQRDYPAIAECFFRMKGVPFLRAEYSRLASSMGGWRASEWIKREYKPCYASLACAMQKREAEFIFNQVIPRLKEGGIPAVTIHDSVLTCQSRQDVVMEVMNDEFKRLGVAAQLRPVSYGLLGAEQPCGAGDYSAA